MHKSRVFLYFILAFLGGVFVGSFFSLPIWLSLFIVSLGVLLIIIFWYERWPIVITGCMAIFFIFGLIRSAATHTNSETLSKLADRNFAITLKGYVAEPPEIQGQKQKITLDVKTLEVERYQSLAYEKVLVFADLYPRYQYGQTVAAQGKINLPKNVGDFDYKNYLAKDGIFTVAYYPKIFQIDLKLSWPERIKINLFKQIYAVKDVFERSIERSIAEPNASFVNGILLGSRSQIPQDIKNDFAKTSTSHILAISGYNITIIAEVVSLILLFFVRRKIAFWFTTIAILIFVILTGAQASVIRAAIMGLLVLLARREGRFYNVKNALALAAAVMAALDPIILRYDVGFQLSFAATMGLVFISPVIERYFQKLPSVFNLKETMAMTLSAQLAVLPLLLYYFKNLSLVSLPANILILPTIPYSMLLGFLSGLGGLIFRPLGQVIGALTWLLSGFQLLIVKLLAKPSWAALSVPFNWFLLVLSYLLIAVVIFWLNKKSSENEN